MNIFFFYEFKCIPQICLLLNWRDLYISSYNGKYLITGTSKTSDTVFSAWRCVNRWYSKEKGKMHSMVIYFPKHSFISPIPVWIFTWYLTTFSLWISGEIWKFNYDRNYSYSHLPFLSSVSLRMTLSLF